jgi:hypothetical protein
MIAGAVVALTVPLGAFAIGTAVDRGILPFGAVREAFDVLGAVLWLGLGVLGPVGIVIFGWSVGARSVLDWFAVAVAGILIVVPVWFLAAVDLSGAMGNPF